MNAASVYFGYFISNLTYNLQQQNEDFHYSFGRISSSKLNNNFADKFLFNTRYNFSFIQCATLCKGDGGGRKGDGKGGSLSVHDITEFVRSVVGCLDVALYELLEKVGLGHLSGVLKLNGILDCLDGLLESDHGNDGNDGAYGHGHGGGGLLGESLGSLGGVLR